MESIVTVSGPYTVTLRPRATPEGPKVAEVGRAGHGRVPLQGVEDPRSGASV